MKFIYTAALLLVLTLSGQAQYGTKTHWGPVIKNSSRSLYMGVFAYNKKGLFGLRYEKENYIIDHFDASLNPVSKGELNLEDRKPKTSLQGLMYLNDKILLFTTSRDKKADINTLHLQTLDQTTYAPDNNSRVLSQIPGTKGSRRGYFSVIVSKDSSRVLVVSYMPYSQDSPEQFNLQVFDADMKPIWDKNIELPYADNLFAVNEFDIDNKGNVYVLGRLYKEVVKEKRRGDVNYTNQVIAYLDNGGRKKEYTIDVENQFITDLKLEVTKSGDLIAAGFYSDLGTYSIKGSYFILIDDETGKVIKESRKDFTLDFITQNLTDKEENKVEKRAEKGKNTELYEYQLDDLAIMEDGTIVMVAEQFYIRVVTTTSTSNGVTTTRTTYYYYFNDIITIFISPEGDIMSMAKIPKRQVSTNDGGPYSSYVKAIHDNKVYFIFNDHPDNLEVLEGERLKYMGRGNSIIPVMVELSTSGKYSKQALDVPVENPKDMPIAMPKLSHQFSRDKILLMTKRKSEEQFGIITFK